MLLNLFHRLRAQFRSQRPLRPLQIFQLILIYILALVVTIRALTQLFITSQPDFFALLIILAMLLCAREVYKGAEGGKWHFHGICVATLFFILLHSWLRYYGYYHREPLTHAILAGLMLEFMAYMLLNKIFAVLEQRRYDQMFSAKLEENAENCEELQKEGEEGNNNQ